jgi:hypothetical protein
MSKYAINLTNELIRVLQRAHELPPHRLIGYAVNIDFWMDEVSHRLHLIDGYAARFTKMRETTQHYTYRDPQWGRDKYGEPIQILDKRTSKSWKSHERNELRSALLTWARKFLKRCYMEEFLDRETLEGLCQGIDIDPSFVDEET